MTSFLLAMLLWQEPAAPVSPAPIVAPIAPVLSLPEEPKAHYDFPSRLAFTMSTQKFGGKLGRVYSGGISYQVSPKLLVSAGYAQKGWAGLVTVRPFAKK